MLEPNQIHLVETENTKIVNQECDVLVGSFSYKDHNYCITCRLLHSKSEVKCRECGMKLRTKPRSLIGKKKYIDDSERI